MRKFYITDEQFIEIEYFQRMFEFNAERIKTLCKEERSDIEYGFELGEIHFLLSDCYHSMLTLTTLIQDQKTNNISSDES